MWSAEGIKEELGLLKVVFSVLAAMIGAMTSWVFQNFEVAAEGKKSFVVIAISVSMVFIVKILFDASECIRKLNKVKSSER